MSLSEYAEVLHLAFHPAITAFQSPKSTVYKETRPNLDCLYAVVNTETAAGCECQRGRGGGERIDYCDPALCVKLQSNYGDHCVLPGPKVSRLRNKPHRIPIIAPFIEI